MRRPMTSRWTCSGTWPMSRCWPARRRPCIGFTQFARRNKAALAAGAVVAVTVLAAVVGLAVGIARIDREKAQKEAALEEAEGNLLLARQAVDEIYAPVAQQLAILPYMQPYQRDVLEKTL